MQKDFKQGDPENGILSVSFFNVSKFTFNLEDLDCDLYGILNVKFENDMIIFMLYDDINSAYKELSFSTESVLVN